ncbi:hypothetical protein AGMMS49573_05580 [Endomicrobiia bacterium]|uniref:ATP cone domain-containing protein n=1 Tax=Endomicrobium trichonymphae TaxID=1408204 RepID=UPI000326005D|nr:ATP cone domain-containing protein [Candidatus Endomicrobium trichonymphae]GHT03746.1 hypothetical protein AGMMS49523_00030 [Endomicrobiia bacterium]GHT08998.1 hypothetical protein AGMMS49532_05590 [Endomicrobiia bacterium]GHT11300.1 hypothetical protein AGMMS49571_01410 [Endomicrobiia bacterium]GHT16304.1 hypothetical protein AGMMS49573_05580 [Endomicrobiia bacterium]GHT19549.1 hypothetical protein AGMMS49929_03520 [Endomicrobiia bacterium]
MNYPFCGINNDQVLDSLPIEHVPAVRRLRKWLNYKTFERPKELPIMVVKSDSRREPFDRRKIWAGMYRKRSISSETINKMVSKIEDEIVGECIMEIPSRNIG